MYIGLFFTFLYKKLNLGKEKRMNVHTTWVCYCEILIMGLESVNIEMVQCIHESWQWQQWRAEVCCQSCRRDQWIPIYMCCLYSASGQGTLKNCLLCLYRYNYIMSCSCGLSRCCCCLGRPEAVRLRLPQHGMHNHCWCPAWYIYDCCLVLHTIPHIQLMSLYTNTGHAPLGKWHTLSGTTQITNWYKKDSTWWGLVPNWFITGHDESHSFKSRHVRVSNSVLKQTVGVAWWWQSRRNLDTGTCMKPFRQQVTQPRRLVHDPLRGRWRTLPQIFFCYEMAHKTAKCCIVEGPSHQVVLLQVQLQDGILHCRKHKPDVLCICCTCEMGIDDLIRVRVQIHKHL